MAGALAVPAPTVLLQSSSADSTVFFLVMFGGGLYLVYNGFNTWQRMRLMQDTATEKVRSAAAGRTELNGAGYPLSAPIERPFGAGDCLLATYKVERYDNDDDGGNWDTIDSGTIAEPFHLDDGTGTMRVEPDESTIYKFEDSHINRTTVGARSETPADITEFLRTRSDVSVQDKSGVSGFLFSDRRRYTEKWIPVGQELYLLGGTTPVDVSEQNSSGLVLRQDEASEEFVISERDESELVTEARWKAPAKMVGGLLASVAGLYLLLSGGL